MSSPSVVLTSKFTLPTAANFSKYLNYITRKNAIKEKGVMSEEKSSLNDLLDNAEIYLERNTASSEKNEDYTNYLNYMKREYATQQSNTSEFLTGVFSSNSENISRKDLPMIEQTIASSQKNGAVLFQDVISFDTDFLVKEKIYNPLNGELNEQLLKRASKKMMDTLIEKEDLQNPFWIASIHRNTKHLHIHFATLEKVNTRPVIQSKDSNGNTILEPRGNRKQSTLDKMKTDFTNTLIDRSSNLTKISNLRNELVKNIRTELKLTKEEKEVSSLLIEIRKELPEHKNKWQYNSKEISDSTRKKIDSLSELLIKDHKNFKEFKDMVKQEEDYRSTLYGDTKRNYSSNKMSEIKTRLGNSVLKQMITLENQKNSQKKNFEKTISERRSDDGKQRTPSTRDKKWDGNIADKKKPLGTDFENPANHSSLYLFKKNLNKLKYQVNNDYAMFRAEREFEYINKKIELDKG